MNNETIADILREMHYGPIPKHRTDNELLCLYADRIKAAHERELVDTLNTGAFIEATRKREVADVKEDKTMSSKPSEHDEIIAEARKKYTVHHCGQCEFRKSCYVEFDSDACKDMRQSIMLGFGIEDGVFTKLLDRLEAAHKREVGVSKTETTTPTCKVSLQVGNEHKPMTLDEAIAHAEEAVNDTPCGREHKQLVDWLKKLREIKISNAAKIREALQAALPIMRNCPFTHYNTTEVDKVVEEMEFALAAPPRYCDKCNSPSEAVALAVNAGVVSCNMVAVKMAVFMLADVKGGAE